MRRKSWCGVALVCVAGMAGMLHASGRHADRTVRVATFPKLLLACQAAQPGDTIVLAPGVYRIEQESRIMIRNRPGPVTVRGETNNPADVIVEGQGQDNEVVQMAFNLEDAPRWTFRNLTTRNTYYHGFKFDKGSTDCRLENVVMRDHGEGGVKGTSAPEAGKYPDRLRVENCTFDFTRGGTRPVVEGIDGVAVRDWVVRGCRFINQNKVSGDPAYAVFTKGNAGGTVIENNRFEDCYIGASFGGGGTGAAYFRDGDRSAEHRGGVIRNNVFIRCRDAGVYLNRAKNAEVSHNTLFDCGLTIQLRYKDTSARVINNLVKVSASAPDEPLVRVRDGATLLEGKGNRGATDADFVQPSGSSAAVDVHLLPNSPARASGIPLAKGVTHRPDIGAYPLAP